MNRRRAPWCAALAVAWAFGAQAGDGLSGTYLPAGDSTGLPADAALTVRAEGRGWLATFRGEGLALLPLAGVTLPDLTGTGATTTLAP